MASQEETTAAESNAGQGSPAVNVRETNDIGNGDESLSAAGKSRSPKAPPRVLVSMSSTPSSSPSLGRQSYLSPHLRSSPGLRSRSPQIRRQLILRTGRSPSPSPRMLPRTFTTYCSSPGGPARTVSDTSSECRGSTLSDMCISTVSQPTLSFTSIDLSDVKSNQPVARSVTPIQPADGRFAYSNQAFVRNDEMILNPVSLCK